MISEPAPEPLIGQLLAARYLIEAQLGEGAMGAVYRARHVKVGRSFAVKVLHRRLLGDDKLLRRFAREAELAGSLHHANIVSVVDVGETPDGLRYLVMEYAAGSTLYDLICQAAPMPAARVISLVRQLCAGLEHAHDRGLIHRDFKPENVIVEQAGDGSERPKIVDFGVAILRDEAGSSSADRLTSVGLVLGTPHYMPPEHATGAPIDHRIDLFALGVICFEMLTGRPPFDGDGVDVARANLLLDTPAMAARVPNLKVDPLLEAFTRKLMMKSRDARPASARAARELLDLIDRDRPAAAAALGVTLASQAPPTPLVAMPRPSTDDAFWLLTDLPPAPPLLSIADAPSTLSPWPAPHETDQIALPRSRHVGRAIAAIAGLIVIAAMMIALGAHRPTQAVPQRASAPPLEALPTPAPQTAAPGTESAAPSTPDALPQAAVVIEAPRPQPATTPSPASLDQPVAARAPHVAAHPSVIRHASLRTPSLAPAPPVTPAPSPERPAVLPVALDISAQTAPAPIAPAAPPSQILIAQPPPPGPATVPPSTASRIAQLYGLVGKQLKSLDQARGSAATADLWVLYLRIRINDVIVDPVKREEADVLLHRLYDQITIRAH